MMTGNGTLGRRRAYGSKYMAPEDIEQILRIQWKSLHSGCAYIEDYYYQVLIALCLEFCRGGCAFYQA